MNSPTPTATSTAPADSLLEELGCSTVVVPDEEVSNHYSPGTSSGIEERALALLGSGINSEQVAAALGVTPSRIAQLLGDETFSHKVATIRYEFLQQHNTRDAKYDSLEDRLLAKLDESVPLMFKPETIMKALQVANAAKRRGQNAPTSVTNTQNIVNLVLPVAIAQRFSLNVDNQVIKAGDQELLTMPSSRLLKQVEASRELKALEHNPTAPPITPSNMVEGEH